MTRVKITKAFDKTTSAFHNREGSVLSYDEDGWFEVLVDGHEDLGTVPFHSTELTTLA